MDKFNIRPCIPVPMRLVCLCHLWCVFLSQWEWTWMSGWLLGLCYWKQCAQSARLSVWKKTRMQIFFACIVTQTLLGITPGLIFNQSPRHPIFPQWSNHAWFTRSRRRFEVWTSVLRPKPPAHGARHPVPVPSWESSEIVGGWGFLEHRIGVDWIGRMGRRSYGMVSFWWSWSCGCYVEVIAQGGIVILLKFWFV